MGKRSTERVNGNGASPRRRPKAWTRNWRDFDPQKVEGDRTLIEELTTYRDHLDELLERQGDYVLIKGKKVIGIFADREEAVDKAIDLFGGEPALVKQIVAREPIHTLGSIVI
jgi:hypothetical protein